ncbi:MAG: Spy/CpxP family protein refolding chaperone [Candidatus Eremiobacteraeota bacterium]|nr:Spy/CpxP family protein refolding chaperone [Candidatus Eremiobacteraeota bacterium]
MKKLIQAAVLAAALTLPVVAVAGEAPVFFPLDSPTAQALHLTAQQQQQMSQVWTNAHARLRQLHVDGRSQILGTLSAQQRSSLAQVIGNMAIAANPDEDVAAQQIQNLLTPAQAQRIISLHGALMQQAMNIMQAAKTQADSYLTPEQRQKFQQDIRMHEDMGMHGMMGGHGGMMGSAKVAGNSAAEAGHILLAISLHHGGDMMYRVRVEQHTP